MKGEQEPTSLCVGSFVRGWWEENQAEFGDLEGGQLSGATDVPRAAAASGWAEPETAREKRGGS